MKLGLYFIIFLLVSVMFEEKSFSLTNYQIKKICKKEKKISICIEDLQEKRSKLQKGNFIEIPVLPYKGN